MGLFFFYRRATAKDEDLPGDGGETIKTSSHFWLYRLVAYLALACAAANKKAICVETELLYWFAHCELFIWHGIPSIRALPPEFPNAWLLIEQSRLPCRSFGAPFGTMVSNLGCGNLLCTYIRVVDTSRIIFSVRIPAIGEMLDRFRISVFVAVQCQPVYHCPRVPFSIFFASSLVYQATTPYIAMSVQYTKLRVLTLLRPIITKNRNLQAHTT